MTPKNVRQHRNCEFALVVFQGIKFVQHKCQVGNLPFVGEVTDNGQANSGHSPHAVCISQAECGRSLMMDSKVSRKCMTILNLLKNSQISCSKNACVLETIFQISQHTLTFFVVTQNWGCYLARINNKIVLFSNT